MDDSLQIAEEDLGEEDVGTFEKPGPPQDFGTAELGVPGDGSTGSFVAEPFQAEPSLPEKEEDKVASLPLEYEKPGPRDFGSAEQGMPGDGSTGSFVAEPYQAEPLPPEKEEDKVASLPLKEEVRDRLLPYRSTHLLEDIYFAFDRYDLDDRSRAILKNNMAYLKAHPDLKIEIQGHCDERGTNRYNMSLGERRAQSTKSYLISLGVDENQIRTISFGEERPFCFESNEICWYQNRRAHFLLAAPRQSHVEKRR
jgi:peptidoglycan-associated lipoprotein